MHNALSKHSLTEFTRAEFLGFVKDISHVRGRSEEEDDAWVNHFARLIEPYPGGTDILFWPEPDADDSSEGVVTTIERYFRQHGLPCFRDAPN